MIFRAEIVLGVWWFLFVSDFSSEFTCRSVLFPTVQVKVVEILSELCSFC